LGAFGQVWREVWGERAATISGLVASCAGWRATSDTLEVWIAE